MKKIKEMSKKDKIKYFAILSLLILLIIGTAFALIRLITKQDTVNLVESGCFDVAMANQENAINLEKAFPLTDEQGRNLTPFTFTLTNNCNVTAKYTVNLEVLSGSTLNTNYVATLVNNGIIKTLGTLPKVDTTINDSLESRTIETGILPANASLDFSVSIWVDEDVTLNDDAMNKILKSKVIVVSTPTNIKTKTEEIIAQLDTTGKCPTVNEDGTITVSSTEELTSAYVCSAPDNYGTSYYYRGNVENNYVKLGKWSDDTPDVVYGFYNADSYDRYEKYESIEACKASSYNNNCTLVSRKGKDMYWRIVRINGDGSVRLVYDGTKTLSANLAAIDFVIPSSVEYDFSTYYNYLTDNSSAGYMHGEITGIVKSSKTYTITLEQSGTYNLGKTYKINDYNFFELENPKSITGSNLDDKYIGYYFFGSDSSTIGSALIKEITNITKNDDKIEVEFYVVSLGTTSKEQAQTNKIDSYTKKIVDNWYQSNISNTEVENYISDSLFCNDRTISNTKIDADYTNLGYGVEPTGYRWLDNYTITSDSIENLKPNVNVRLTCPNQNDAFTVNDTKKGNGALTYASAILTADEAMLSGSISESGYLYNHNAYAPILYTGDMLVPSYDTSNDSGISPVINVKADTLLYGDGTASNPYRPIE